MGRHDEKLQIYKRVPGVIWTRAPLGHPATLGGDLYQHGQRWPPGNASVGGQRWPPVSAFDRANISPMNTELTPNGIFGS